MAIQDRYRAQGAALAPDGIPLHFGDLKGEYHAALNAAILLDRSHEGRIEISGKDRFEILNRISTNDTTTMQPGEARATLLTNPTGRILERLVVFNWHEDRLLVLTGPGRGMGVLNYLQRQIFFNDEAKVADITANTYQFNLHGATSTDVIAALAPEAANLDVFQGKQVSINGAEVFIGRLKPFSHAHYIVIPPADAAESLWDTLLTSGAKHDLRPSGGLTYNTLRIRAGFPGAGRELHKDYIPLEVGLWDEVSFNKGCYTGQEIIARMESRQQLAKTLVRLNLPQFVEAPTTLYKDGRAAGTLTSSVTAPTGEHFGIGIVKTAHIESGVTLSVDGDGSLTVEVAELLGTQPDWIGG